MCELELGGKDEGTELQRKTSKLPKCLSNLQEIPWSLSRQLSNSWKLKVHLIETFSIKCLFKKIQCKTSENVNIMNYTGADREDILNCSAHLSASTGFFQLLFMMIVSSPVLESYTSCHSPCVFIPQLHFEMFPNILSFLYWLHLTLFTFLYYPFCTSSAFA